MRGRTVRIWLSLIWLVIGLGSCATHPPAPRPSTSLPAQSEAASQASTPPVLYPAPYVALRSAIGATVQAQIDAGAMPGAVVAVGDAQAVWFRQAYGLRALLPTREAMTLDTIFDLASLTKVVVTTTAIMQLVEQGRIELDAPVARYWPAFASRGKAAITVRQLLAHTSGLRPDIDTTPSWHGQEEAFARVLSEKPRTPPGTAMVYSDINFMVLGELVRRVSGQPLPEYARDHIFEPLGMHDTTFLPPESWRTRIAPTELRGNGTLMRGQVHDPIAHRMGGWAGHAGAFSTVDDLIKMAQALLHSLPKEPAAPDAAPADQPRLFRPETLLAMAHPQSPRTQAYWRSLGWSLDAPLWAGRDALPPVGLIGHTGYTGTGMWIDLVQRRFVIILSNRVHPHGLGDARPLRRQILALVSALQPPQDWSHITQALPTLRDIAPQPAPAAPPQDRPAVATGIDVLREEGYALLKGQRVGLISNLSAVDAHGWRTLDRLRWAPGVQLQKIFTPEHGFNRDQEGRIASGTEGLSGLPMISLYGRLRYPTPEMLADLDTLVFDMQDAGVRFFTYTATLRETMEAAARAGLNYVVLDRPDPIGADRVAGPMLDANLRSFTAPAELPVQYGMTLGELARFFRDDIRRRTGLDVKLHVVTMHGYRRDMRFDDTRLDWVPPSPNLRTLRATLLYPGTSWLEGANVSVGRGTDHPFEWIGAPWIDSARWLPALQALGLPGVRFDPISFKPDSSTYKDRVCQGVQIHITDRTQLDAPLLGLALTRSLHALWPHRFELDKTLGMIGSRHTLALLHEDRSLDAITQDWEEGLRTFDQQRQADLLY